MKTLLTLIVVGGWIGLSSIRSLAAAGDLDLTFGPDHNGKVTTQIGAYDVIVGSVALQPDGKIVVVGDSTHCALVRYNVDGSVDRSFGGRGDGTVACAFEFAYGVAIQPQPDGSSKIIVAGESWNGQDRDFALARYNLDGSLDFSFGGNGTGTVQTDFGHGDDTAYGVAVQILPNGSSRIVAAGECSNGRGTDFALAGYDHDGRPDPSFGLTGQGTVTTDFGELDGGLSIALGPKGQIAVAGSTQQFGSDAHFAVACYTRDGAPDAGFGSAGRATTSFGSGNDVACGVAYQIQPDGSSKIVAVGECFNGRDIDFALVRYNPDGKPDPSFGINGNGLVWTDFPAAGPSYDHACGVAIQPADSRIVVVGGCTVSGRCDFALACYTSDGHLTSQTATDFGTSDDWALGVAIQPADSKIVVAGFSDFRVAVARYDGGASVAPSVTVAVTPAETPEDGTGSLVYTFARNGPTDRALEVNFDVAGMAQYGPDYQETGAPQFARVGTTGAGAVPIPAGQTTARVVIDPTTDPVMEPDETVILTLTGGYGYWVGAPFSATGMIRNDDTTTVTVTVSPPAVWEDGFGALVYTFARSPATIYPLLVKFGVSGTATYDVDYTQDGARTFSATAGTVLIPASDTTAQIQVYPTPDTVDEPNETVILTVTVDPNYVAAAPSTATGTIREPHFPCAVLVDLGSVELEYDDARSPYYTQISHTLSPVQNWTAGGATSLSMWVHGQSTNAPAMLWVALQDSGGKVMVVSHFDRTVVQKEILTPWTIPLGLFTGVDLSKVKQITLGVGDRNNPTPGGTGVVYLEEIVICGSR